MGWRVKGVLLGILLLGTLLRLKGITNPLLDNQGWRQADTASMALNMLGHLGKFPDVLFPLLNYDGMGPQKVELEFPFLPYLLALTWQGLGWADLWGRLWAIGFSLLTIWGIYELGQQIVSMRVGLWAAAFYAVIPLTVYYGRVVMPEPVTQTLSVWALNSVLKWRREETGKNLVFAGLLMAGAILAKLPQLMIFPVALAMGFWPFKEKRKKLIQYCLLALSLPMLYYSWVHVGAGEASQFVSGIISGQVVEGPRLFKSQLRENLREGFGFTILFFAGGGYLRILWKSITERDLNPKEKGKGTYAALLLWGLISLFYLGIVCLRIPLDYYLIPIALPLALFASISLDLLEDNPGFVLGILVLSLLLVNQMLIYPPKYSWDERYLTQAHWIKEHTRQDDVLVLSDSPPMTLYYARRYGFRLNSAKEEEAWEQLQVLPGNYLIALPGSRSQEFWSRVEEKYPLIGPGVYRLKQSGEKI